MVPNVIGLQFHLEVTPQATEAMLNRCGSELVPGPFVQTASEILGAAAGRYATINALLDDVLSHLTTVARPT